MSASSTRSRRPTAVAVPGGAGGVLVMWEEQEGSSWKVKVRRVGPSIEVEAVILKHTAVQEAAVVGMADAQWGETPHAFVVLRSGATVESNELREFVRARLAHFKCPRAFHFVPELPKTATGKIQKFVLRGKKASISAQ